MAGQLGKHKIGHHRVAQVVRDITVTMKVRIIEETSLEKSGQVARISMSAETAFDGIALAKLGELLTTEAGYEQVITFLFGSGEQALAINEALESAGQTSRR